MVKNIFLAVIKLNCQIFFGFQIIIPKYLNLILTNKNFGIKITKEIFIGVDIYWRRYLLASIFIGVDIYWRHFFVNDFNFYLNNYFLFGAILFRKKLECDNYVETEFK